MSGFVLSCVGFGDRAALQRAADDLLAGGNELLALSTCQRHELFVLGEPVEAASLGAGAESLGEGQEAAVRLFEITCGVLSRVPGERAVARQVEAASREAQRLGVMGPRLARLVNEALETGWRLRHRAERTAPILELGDLVAEAIDGAWQPGSRAALLGAGPLARSVLEAARGRGREVTLWGSRRPRPPRPPGGPTMRIAEVLAALRPGDVLVTALANAPGAVDAAVLDRGVTVFDLAVPGNVTGARWTVTSVVAAAAQRLEPQAEALRRAAHRIPALARRALAESVAPSMAPLARTVARFKDDVVETELRRLASWLGTLPAVDADRLRRSIRHTAARCVHPLHEYINDLGRRGRPEEAATVIDHLRATGRT